MTATTTPALLDRHLPWHTFSHRHETIARGDEAPSRFDVGSAA